MYDAHLWWFSSQREKRSSNFMYLMIEFRCVKCDDKEYGIVYYEKVCALQVLWSSLKSNICI